jgi:hypothetical protein
VARRVVPEDAEGPPPRVAEPDRDE